MEEEKIENKKKDKKVQKREDEIAKLKSDLDYWQNQYYKAYADTQNLRKDIEKEHREAMKYRAEGFIDKLLPALDGFHLALQNEVKSEELKNYLVGFQYIYRNLSEVLESEGVKEIAPKKGDTFDAKTMHALEAVEDDGEENKVLAVYSKGYMLHDRMIRPAMVYVSKKKEINSDEKIANKEEK